jgi:hypothetical protein
MKYAITGILLGFLYLTTNAQLNPDSLRANHFTLRVASDGAIENWRVGNDRKLIMYTQSLWIGGLSNSTLYQSSQRYRLSKINFFPGPISTDPVAVFRYNRVWRVTKNQVDSLKQGYYNPIPPIFYDWPAHGDTSFGEPWLLAPFTDVDQDGIYNPDNGDYPDIKGTESIFFICNDSFQQSMNDNPLGIDIMGQVYRNEGGILDSMFFVEYEIVNRSDSTYSSTYLSTWADMDLGNAFDDLVGTEINYNATLSYNGDPNDEGSDGFGHELASAAMFIRQGPYADYFNGVDDDRDGCVDGVRDSLGNCISEDPVSGINERMLMSSSNFYSPFGIPSFSSPANEGEERQLMLGRCNNGAYKEVHSPYAVWDPSIPPTNCNGLGAFVPFVFPGSSYDTSGAYPPFIPLDWYESPADKNDHKMLGSVGPFTFQPNERLNLKLGFIWHQADSSSSAGDGGYGQLLHKLERAYRSDPSYGGLSTYHHKQQGESILVFYHQEHASWYVESKKEDHQMAIFDLSGRLLQSFYLEKGMRKRLEINSLASGVYILVDTDNGYSYRITR